MDKTPQVVPLYRRNPSELLTEWEKERRAHSHTIAEFRRRLSPSDPDRSARFRYAMGVLTDHVAALSHRIERAKGVQGTGRELAPPIEEPEPCPLWQSR